MEVKEKEGRKEEEGGRRLRVSSLAADTLSHNQFHDKQVLTGRSTQKATDKGKGPATRKEKTKATHHHV